MLLQIITLYLSMLRWNCKGEVVLMLVVVKIVPLTSSFVSTVWMGVVVLFNLISICDHVCLFDRPLSCNCKYGQHQKAAKHIGLDSSYSWFSLICSYYIELLIFILIFLTSKLFFIYISFVFFQWTTLMYK